jgi:hypothetical protein
MPWWPGRAAWARYAEAFIYIATEKMFELAAPAAQEA